LVSGAGAWIIPFCWISAAVIGLVTLRKGPSAGLGLLAWALLPSGLVLYAFGNSEPLSMLIGATVLALVLRSTVKLEYAVLMSVLLAAVTGLGHVAFGGEYLNALIEVFGQLFAWMEAQLSTAEAPVALPTPDAILVSGALGTWVGGSAIICLLLARYWQAALYNPGGFGQEFKALRFTPVATMTLALAAIAVSSLGAQYGTWAMMCMMPLAFAGISLVHAWVAARGRGAGWIAGFYVALVLLDPVKLAVIFVAIADSWFDFRRRWAPVASRDIAKQAPERDQKNDD
ncbi:MAG: hypothetical protein AAGF35_13340, partial [Pseudomonadota bacterium]